MRPLKERQTHNKAFAPQPTKGKLAKIPEKEDDNINKIGKNKFQGFSKLAEP